MAKDFTDIEKRIADLKSTEAALQSRIASLRSSINPNDLIGAAKLQQQIDQLNISLAKTQTQIKRSTTIFKRQYDSLYTSLKNQLKLEVQTLNQKAKQGKLSDEELKLQTKLESVYTKLDKLSRKRKVTESERAELLEEYYSQYQTITDELHTQERLANQLNSQYYEFGSEFLNRIPLGNTIREFIKDIWPELEERLTNLLGKLTSKMFNNEALAARFRFGMMAFMKGITAAMERQNTFKPMQRQLGLNNEQMLVTRDIVEGIASRSLTWYMTTEKIVEAHGELASVFGKTLADSQLMLDNQIKLKTIFGLSSEEAIQFSETAILTKRAQEEQLIAAVGTVEQYRKATGFGFKLENVLKKVNSLSGSIRAMFGNITERMSLAVMKAQMMGTSLQDVQQQMSGMLDFENSITDEITSQVLNSNKVNLDNLRKAAFFGNPEEYLSELQKVIPSFEEFQKMVPLQRDYFAKALNMNSDQLAEMVNRQEIMQTLGFTQMSQLDELMRRSPKEIDQALKNVNSDMRGKIEQMIEDIQAPTAQEKLEKTMNMLSSNINKLSNVMIIVGGIIAGNAIGGKIGAIVGGLAGLGITKFGGFTDINDGIINPNGGLVVAKPEGGIVAQVNKKDNIIASTNPLQQTNNDNSYNSNNTNKIEKLLSILIEKVSQPVYVNVNGNVLREINNQISLNKEYLVGLGNSYKSNNKMF